MEEFSSSDLGSLAALSYTSVFFASSKKSFSSLFRAVYSSLLMCYAPIPILAANFGSNLTILSPKALSKSGK
jgi:hypothetical protein